METKPRAIVLGGTNPHITLINNLKGRGYYVYLLDYLDNPVAKVYADEHIKESTLDKERVLSIAQSLNAELVISTSIDQANTTACFVAERLNLPHPYSYETALLVTNKNLMKNMFIKHGIPTSRFIKVLEYSSDIEQVLNFPLVVKPADSTGSKGVVRVDTTNELKEYLAAAIEISRDKSAIVEEFNEGNEYQLDFIVDNERSVSLIMVREKIKLHGKSNSELQNLGSIFPIVFDKVDSIKIMEIAQSIVKAFDLKNTPFFIQLIKNNRNINVLEFAVRIGGGLSYSIIKLATGVDMLNATVDSFLGHSLSAQITPTNHVYATYLLYAEKSIFSHFEGVEDMVKSGYIDEFYRFKSEGDVLDGTLKSSSRVGGFLVKGDNQINVLDKIHFIMNNIEVMNMGGEPVLMKNF